MYFVNKNAFLYHLVVQIYQVRLTSPHFWFRFWLCCCKLMEGICASFPSLFVLNNTLIGKALFSSPINYMANRVALSSFTRYSIIRESIIGPSRSALAQEQVQRRRGPSSLPPPPPSPTKQRQQRFLATGSRFFSSQRGEYDAIRGSYSRRSSQTTNTTISTGDATAQYEVLTTTTTQQQQQQQTTATTRTTAAAAAAKDMASDEDYMAFLNKANKDADEAHAYAAETVRAQAGARAQLKTLDAGETAPQVIADVCKQAVYTSDADEPFKEVSLRWKGQGGLPDEGMFISISILLQQKSQVRHCASLYVVRRWFVRLCLLSFIA